MSNRTAGAGSSHCSRPADVIFLLGADIDQLPLEERRDPHHTLDQPSRIAQVKVFGDCLAFSLLRREAGRWDGKGVKQRIGSSIVAPSTASLSPRAISA